MKKEPCRYQRGTLVFLACVVAACLLPGVAWAQRAGLSGVVRDPQGAVIADANLQLIEVDTSIVWTTQTNSRGIYVFPSVKPSTYRLEATAAGFEPSRHPDLVLHVDERATLDVTLELEGRTEQVQVVADRPMLGTRDGSVGTVIDSQFAANLPVRARSFSSLVGLAPGATHIPGRLTSTSGSEFNVNGQRDTANSLTVDGVSGLSELGASGMLNGAGQRLSSTQNGTVNGGISMDAVQEIRIQTSTFAAEFGRTPGAQISLVTRSGSNRFTGSAFEQFRNDALMANDWFANSHSQKKPAADEHQFGGTLGGPIIHNRAFFFASYEGLRLRLPIFQTATVPSNEARQMATVLRDVLNAYPVPTGPTRSDLTAESARFYPQRYYADTLGLRVDQAVAPGVQLFARYSRTPSHLDDDNPLAGAQTADKNAQAITGGLTAALGGRTLIDARGSFGQTDGTYENVAQGIRGWLPGGVPETANLSFGADDMNSIYDGPYVANRQRQFNVVGSLSYIVGSHQLKAGVDYRRLRPLSNNQYTMGIGFPTLEEALHETSVSYFSVFRRFPVEAAFENLSVYAQDTWKALRRLSISYGVRWDINPAPDYSNGEGPLAALTFSPISDIRLTEGPNHPLWATNYGNLSPRLGLSYALDDEARTLLSGGVGLFADIEGSAIVGQGVGPGVSAQISRTDVPLPLTSADVRPPEEPNYAPPYPGGTNVIDPNLATPRTLQWNLSVQRTLSRQQFVSVTYVGSRGDRLLQNQSFSSGQNALFAGTLGTMSSTGRSRYQSLQLQYRARVRSSVNALASYTLARAKDTTSTSAGLDRAITLAPSDFDLHHAFNAGVSWLPSASGKSMAWLLDGWGLHAIVSGRSGYPFSVYTISQFTVGAERFRRRASFVPGVPLILEDGSAPGGQRLNPAAFINPPSGQQGDTSRNQFRGLGTYQVDLSAQKSIRLGSTSLRLRVDAFNAFNHPVFSLPLAYLGLSPFGVPIGTPATDGGAIGSLYQSGGPRTVALSARIEF